MADARLSTPFERKEVLSPLMRAKMNAINGETVNRCPFGCALEELDESGYCRHLVGFTSDRKFYEPMVLNKKTGRRQVHVNLKLVGTRAVPDLLPVQKDDQFDTITTCSRVYRKDATDTIWNPEEDAKPVKPPEEDDFSDIDDKPVTKGKKSA
jgi:hypothetical protein